MNAAIEARAARLLELAPAQIEDYAIVLADPGGTIVGWLGGAQRLFGYSAPEIIGANLAKLFTPEDITRGIPVWERQVAQHSHQSEDDRWQVRKDGARIWVAGVMTALHEADGTLAGFIKLMRNRTDHKSQIEALERTVAMLERTESQRVRFVSTLAHELRNPLGTIGTANQMLDASRNASPEIRFASGMIRRQVEFMSHMIKDLLDVASTVTGKVPLRKEPLVLQDVLTHSLEACRASIDTRSHQLHYLVPEGAIPVEGDPVRLRQLFVNVIENAAKYTPPRGTIWVRASTEGDDAVVRVRDTGVGILPEQMPTIFDLFTRGEPAQAEPAGGLGIGLALVKDTVAQHGGTVQATSAGAGKGSEFTIRLPIRGIEGSAASKP